MKKRKKVAKRFPAYDDDRVKKVLAGKTKTPIVDEIKSRKSDRTIPASVVNGERTFREAEFIAKFGEALYDRARKKIGMTDEMIASYSDAESLKKACDGMHSKSNPDARIKEGVQPVPPKFEQNRPDFLVLESVLHAKFVLRNRVQFDEGNLQSFLRHVNRKYGSQKPVRIVKDVSFEIVKHELVTRFTIFFVRCKISFP